jgi:hypothetical protein
MSCSEISSSSGWDLDVSERDAALRLLVLLEFWGYTDTTFSNAATSRALLLETLSQILPSYASQLQPLRGAALAGKARQLRKEIIGKHCDAKRHLQDPRYNLKEIQNRAKVLQTMPKSTDDTAAEGPCQRSYEALVVEALAEEALGLAAAQAATDEDTWTTVREVSQICRETLPSWECEASSSPTESSCPEGGSAWSRAFDVASAVKRCAMNLALLEDHLSCDEKFCPDCLCKHALMAEAFALCAIQTPSHSPLICRNLAPLWPWLCALRKQAEKNAGSLLPMRDTLRKCAIILVTVSCRLARHTRE